MRKIIIYLVTAVLIIALLAFACTFTVRFTEAAVVTTLGKAGENDVITTPGLRFKFPYFQSVTKYDTRVRVLTTKLETLQTADSRQVVVETFCSWRVVDPLKFFQRFSNAGYTAEEHYRKAEDALRGNVRAAGALVSKYRIGELFTSGNGSSESPISKLEAEMKATFSSGNKTGLNLDEYGIAAVDVGITRIVLPEETTKAVFERMKIVRESLAQGTESKGQATAQFIKAKAESDARKITDFADRLAQEIRNRGELEAAPYFTQMNANPELAVFLENMNFIRQSFGRRTTLILSGAMPGINMLFPNAVDRMKSGQIPSPMEGNWMSDAIKKGSASITPEDLLLPKPAAAEHTKPQTAATAEGTR